MRWDVHRAMRIATEALAVGMLSFSLQVALRSGFFGWGSDLMFKEALLISSVLLLAWLGVMARQDLLVWLAGGFLVFESAVTWMGLGKRLLLPAMLMLALYAIAAFTRPGEASREPDPFPGRRGVPIPIAGSRGRIDLGARPWLGLQLPTVPLHWRRRERAFVAPRTHPQGMPPSVRRALAHRRHALA